VAQIECRLPFGNGRGDEIRLPETREEREHESTGDPAKVDFQESEHVCLARCPLERGGIMTGYTPQNVAKPVTVEESSCPWFSFPGPNKGFVFILRERPTGRQFCYDARAQTAIDPAFSLSIRPLALGACRT
jgi:hypothetical protein